MRIEGPETLVDEDLDFWKLNKHLNIGGLEDIWMVKEV